MKAIPDTFPKSAGPFTINGSIKRGTGAVFAFGPGSVVIIAENMEALEAYHAENIAPKTGHRLIEGACMKLAFCAADAVSK